MVYFCYTQSMPICEITGIDFELDDLERGLQHKLGVPAPQMLPALRLRHRLTFRNERTLYKRDSSRMQRRQLKRLRGLGEPVFQRLSD